MKKISFFWKLFLAVFFGILLSLLALMIGFRITIPFAFSRHMMDMNMMMRDLSSMNMGMRMIDNELYDVFLLTSTEAIWIALPVVLLISLLISWGISRIIESPLQKMFLAAQDIASGQYHRRIPLSMDVNKTKVDPIQKLAIGFNQMAASLEETEKMRQQLIGDISHELRTPLTTIKGSMEGLMDGVVQGNEQTYHQLYQEADRLQRLVDDLQELSRIEGGAYHLNKQWVSILQLFQSISKKYENRFQEKQVHFSITIPESNIMIFVDPDRLEQVLVNLLMNALQFTDPGDSVSLSAQQQSNQLKIQVQDNGSGIAEEHLPHIFTRFYRVDKSRSRQSGGSGIGLTISKHLVEAHEGTITVESPGIGSGTTFTIRLPMEIKKEKE
ncbi:MAG: two-component sensor histidine kinase [Chloroflexi bacterium HGW-Chloroflexi-3]|nr:MAG: two-component sensor histidine kinase [Chloroflexi bacterium HGW-Chloroflexi-3]